MSDFNVHGQARRAIFSYDISGGVDAGTVGTHVIGSLPANSIILRAVINVATTFTDNDDDSATIALGVTNASTCFDTAIAISDGTAPWDANSTRVSAEAALDVGTSAVNVIATVADDTIDAGKLYLIVDYAVVK